jgi:hypothetical protein
MTKLEPKRLGKFFHLSFVPALCHGGIDRQVKHVRDAWQNLLAHTGTE